MTFTKKPVSQGIKTERQATIEIRSCTADVGLKKAFTAPVTQFEHRNTAPKQKPGPLCVVACNFCTDPRFWGWLKVTFGLDCQNAHAAKEFILAECEINSRKDLDQNERAAALFHGRIRKPFVAWRDG